MAKRNPDVDPQKSAAWVRRVRKRTKLHQWQFGEKVGVGREQVSYWEAGTYVPKADKVRLIVQVDPDHEPPPKGLLDDEEVPPTRVGQQHVLAAAGAPLPGLNIPPRPAGGSLQAGDSHHVLLSPPPNAYELALLVELRKLPAERIAEIFVLITQEAAMLALTRKEAAAAPPPATE